MTRWSYDPATGICTSKTYEDGSVVTYEYTPDGLFETTRTADGHWTRNIYDAKRQLVGVQYDAYGNVMEYRTADGSLAVSYVYDAFGRTISQNGPLADVFRYRYSTKSFECEAGLYYYGKRFYTPLLKRWLNRDPIGETGGIAYAALLIVFGFAFIARALISMYGLL